MGDPNEIHLADEIELTSSVEVRHLNHFKINIVNFKKKVNIFLTVDFAH
jgi:hypothetical protein